MPRPRKPQQPDPGSPAIRAEARSRSCRVRLRAVVVNVEMAQRSFPGRPTSVAAKLFCNSGATRPSRIAMAPTTTPGHSRGARRPRDDAVRWSLLGNGALAAGAAASEDVGAGLGGCGVLRLPVVLLHRVGPVGDAQRHPGDKEQERGNKRQRDSERVRQLTGGARRQVGRLGDGHAGAGRRRHPPQPLTQTGGSVLT